MTTIVSDTSARERIARIIDPDAWHETLRTDGCGEYWMGRRAKARAKADAILASLPSIEGEWLPIASAPKDGTEFLALLSNGWYVLLSAPAGVSEGWRFQWWRGTSNIQVPVEDTHPEGSITGMRALYWRPLPAPPAMLSATPSFDGERGK